MKKLKMFWENLLHLIGWYRKSQVMDISALAMCKIAEHNHIERNDPLTDYRVFRIGQIMLYRANNKFYYNC